MFFKRLKALYSNKYKEKCHVFSDEYNNKKNC